MNCRQNRIGEQCATAAPNPNQPESAPTLRRLVLRDCYPLVTKQVQNKTQEKRPLPLAIGDYRPLQLQLQVAALSIEFESAVGHCDTARRECVVPAHLEDFYGHSDIRSNLWNRLVAYADSRRLGKSCEFFQKSLAAPTVRHLLFAMLPPSFIGEAWLNVE